MERQEEREKKRTRKREDRWWAERGRDGVRKRETLSWQRSRYGEHPVLPVDQICLGWTGYRQEHLDRLIPNIIYNIFFPVLCRTDFFSPGDKRLSVTLQLQQEQVHVNQYQLFLCVHMSRVGHAYYQALLMYFTSEKLRSQTTISSLKRGLTSKKCEQSS